MLNKARQHRPRRAKRRGILDCIGDWVTGPLDRLFYLTLTGWE